MGIISLSINEIETYFSTNRSVTVWIITVFSISSAIGIISLGFLSQIFGRKFIYICGVFGFSLFSGLCGLSNSFKPYCYLEHFRVFWLRFSSLKSSFSNRYFSFRKRSKAISAWTFGLLAGPVVGPLLGGYIIDSHSWRWIFFINVPLGLSAFIGLLIFLKDNSEKNKSSINIFGFIFLSTAAASLQIFLDRGELEDWFDSDLIQFLFMLFILAFILFIYNLSTSKSPLFPKKNF